MTTNKEETNQLLKSNGKTLLNNSFKKNFLNKSDPPHQKMKHLGVERLAEQNSSKFRKILTFKTLLEWLKKKYFINQEQMETLKTINVTTKDLNSRYWKCANIVTKRQYSPELKKFAMTLYYYSSTAYKYVRSNLNLSIPHPQTVQKWYKSIGGSPGFTTEYLEVLKLLANKTKGPLYCCLMMDEMQIREKIECDGDKIHGHVDFGLDLDSDTVPSARSALVFLVTSITTNWKVPVGYFLMYDTTIQQRADLVLQCLKHLNDSDISVVGLTFDLCNFSMATILGCNLNPNDDMKTTFKHPVTKQPIAVFLDNCNIIRLVRISLQSHGEFVTASGQNISWAHVENLNKLQNTEYFKLQLRKRHMISQNQNVKGNLKTQFLSKSIADSLDFCRDDLKIADFKESLATAEFIRLMNDLFDLLNSRNLKQNDYKQPLHLNNKKKVIKFLNYAENYIKGLQTKQGVCLLNSKCASRFIGCLVCIRSTKLLFQQLIEEERIKFLPMHRFSQDHLALFFFNANTSVGKNMSNPTAKQFKSYYRKLLSDIEIKNINDSVHIPLEKIAILNCSSAVQIINATTTRGRLDDDVYDEDSKWSRMKSRKDFDRFCSTLPEMPEFGGLFITYYTTGYVVKTLEKIIHCDECNRMLSVQNPQTGNAFRFDYITFNDNHDSVYPSDDAVKICKVAELEIQEIINKHSNGYIRPSLDKSLLINKVLRCFVNSNIFDSILRHQFDQSPTENHLVNLMKAIADTYIDVRFRYLTRNMTSPATSQLFDNISYLEEISRVANLYCLSVF